MSIPQRIVKVPLCLLRPLIGRFTTVIVAYKGKWLVTRDFPTRTGITEMFFPRGPGLLD